MDIKDLKAQNDIADIIGGYVSLKKHGKEHTGLCPFHDDHNGSLTVYEKGGEGKYKCFACGEGGDVVDFLIAMGKTHKEAFEELSGGVATGASPKKNKTSPKKPRVIWAQILPTAKPETFRHYKHGEPSDKWLYRTPEGKPLGYVLRFDFADGSKQTLPYIFATDGNRSEWRFQGFSDPRPLYGIHTAIQYPEADILLLEGEKCAKFAQSFFEPAKTVVLSWLGGSNGVHKSDWTPLKGRRVTMWADNDASGLSAMLHILHISEFKAWLMPLDESKPKGWDCADAKWTPETIAEYIAEKATKPPKIGERYMVKEIGREAVYDMSMEGDRWRMVERKTSAPIQAPAPIEHPENIEGMTFEEGEPIGGERYFGEQTPAPPKQPETPVQSYDDYENAFRFCGYDKSDSGTQHFYFYVYRSNQIVRLSPSGMATKANLITLAPFYFWQSMFPNSNGGINTDMAASYLIEGAIKAGIYNPDNARGRGCWIDGKDVVMHAGGHLIVNGEPKSFAQYRTKFQYEAATDLEIKLGDPADNKQASKFLALCNALSWERPIYGYLLAGWCAIAPFCGALKWRPHVWITGAAGTGKSWVFDNIVRKTLGATVLAIQSSSTSAGIRQWMGADALPIMFDEAEGETKHDQSRMQDVLTLMRGSSTADGGDVIKGSAGGSAQKYKTRSCFAYASIGVQLTQASDKSRVSVLSISKNAGEEGRAQWEKLQEQYFETMKGNFPERLQSRTISILPSILKNAEVFTSAAAEVLGDQRSGDQIGTLLAGAFSLVSSKEITYREALKWLRERDWSEEQDKEEESDERRLINMLMGKMVATEYGGTKKDRTIGELVKFVYEPGLYLDPNLTQEVAAETLARIGYRVDKEKDLLIVSNTAEQIKTHLRDTPWARNHAGILKRLKGAEAVQPTTFGSHTKSRAVSIPMDTIFG
jgi:putative DNA primase/helicase